jgi:hypothetical protein
VWASLREVDVDAGSLRAEAAHRLAADDEPRARVADGARDRLRIT